MSSTVRTHSSKPWDVVVLGGINTDFVVTSECLPEPGQSVAGKIYYSGPGGKGANQAVAAARLGVRVAIIGRVGKDDRGRELVRGLSANGVDVRHVCIDPKMLSGAAIIAVDASGEKQISVALGANSGVRAFDLDSAEELIAGAKVLLMQLEVPIAAVLRAATLARKHHTKVILDPAPPIKIPEKLFSMLDVIRPNRDEAEHLTQRPIRTREDARAAARGLLNRGIQIVAMEAGRAGDRVMSDNAEIFVPRFKVKSVDATGAGDAYAAAFAVGLAQGLALRDIATLASATAALATTRVGAQEALPMRKEVERLLRRRYFC
jgi:ribokinase